MQYKIQLLLGSTLLLIAASTMAECSCQRSFKLGKVTTSIDLGVINGEANEFVYDGASDGSKLSQLDWKYNNVAVIKHAIGWDIGRWLSLDASGWTTIKSNGGQKMDDYDWMVEGQKQWSEHSWHPDTRLNYANAFDLNISGWILNQPNYRLGLQAGYQENRYSFTAVGGFYSYLNGEYIGEFDYLPAISYQQHFKMPYVGLVGSYRYKDLELGGKFKYSGWVNGSGTDQHYDRQLTFNDFARQQDYYAISLNVGYHLNNHARAYIEGDWNRIINKKGNTTAYNNEDGSTESYLTSSGIAHENFMTSIGLSYTF